MTVTSLPICLVDVTSLFTVLRRRDVTSETTLDLFDTQCVCALLDTETTWDGLPLPMVQLLVSKGSFYGGDASALVCVPSQSVWLFRHAGRGRGNILKSHATHRTHPHTTIRHRPSPNLNPHQQWLAPSSLPPPRPRPRARPCRSSSLLRPWPRCPPRRATLPSPSTPPSPRPLTLSTTATL